MAALLIVGALAIANKVEEKKERRRSKKANDEKRYRELQVETNQRLARRESGTVIDNSLLDEPEEENENEKEAVNDASPPPYEDAVQVGERREREWAERRRSSVASRGADGGALRMG